VLACRFEKIHGAERVNLEIEQGNVPRLVMGRLRRAVDDQIKTVRSKKLFDSGAVANVQRRVCEPLGRGLQPLQIPERVASSAEENPAHVVVHTHDFMALPIEMLDRIRTDEPAAAGDKNFHPLESIPFPMGGKSKKCAGIAAYRIPVMTEIGYERTALSLEEYQQSSGFLTAPSRSTFPFSNRLGTRNVERSLVNAARHESLQGFFDAFGTETKRARPGLVSHADIAINQVEPVEPARVCPLGKEQSLVADTHSGANEPIEQDANDDESRHLGEILPAQASV
jgi:hypothetical protein